MNAPAPRNLGGRPKGREKVNRLALQRAFVAAVEPHAAELMQRAVEQSLSGNSATLAALLDLAGRVMTADAQAQPRNAQKTA